MLTLPGILFYYILLILIIKQTKIMVIHHTNVDPVPRQYATFILKSSKRIFQHFHGNKQISLCLPETIDGSLAKPV